MKTPHQTGTEPITSHHPRRDRQVLAFGLSRSMGHLRQRFEPSQKRSQFRAVWRGLLLPSGPTIRATR